MAGGGGGAAGASAGENLAYLSAKRPGRRWDRGVWIRFILAITPTVVFAVLGYLQSR